MPSTDELIADELYVKLAHALKASEKEHFYSAIVEAPFEHAKDMAFIFLGFLCYFSVDHDKGVIKLEQATCNEYYTQAVADYNFDRDAFVLPLTATDNSIVKAALEKRIVSLSNWDKMRRPEVEEGVARLNQATSGIAYSLCVPIGDKGVLGFNFFQPKEILPPESEAFAERYGQLVTAILG